MPGVVPGPSPLSWLGIVFPEWKEEQVTHLLTKPGEFVKFGEMLLSGASGKGEAGGICREIRDLKAKSICQRFPIVKES